MATYEAESAELVKIRNLNSYSRRVYTIVKVVSKTEAREVSGGARRVVEALVGDDTASIYLTLWDDAIDKVKEGQILNIKNAYVNLFRGSMRLNLGRFGSYELAESAPFEEVNLDNNLSSKVFERRSYDRGGFGGRDRRYGGERGRRARAERQRQGLRRKRRVEEPDHSQDRVQRSRNHILSPALPAYGRGSLSERQSSPMPVFGCLTFTGERKDPIRQNQHRHGRYYPTRVKEMDKKRKSAGRHLHRR